MHRPTPRPRAALAAGVAGLVALLLSAAALTGCGTSTGSGSAAAPSSAAVTPAKGGQPPTWTAAPKPPRLLSPYTKVMVIAEENETDDSVIGSSQAPYVTRLAASYGRATAMVANYPVSCPSLAAYIIMTSGNRQGICDDNNPSVHQLSSSNIFQQVADAGMQWRQYAESMPANCQQTNSSDGLYLVRHAPPPYYTSESSRCASWDVPLGTTSAGALHDALANGLPAYSFVTPNACNDMHGAASCPTGVVARGDSWLAAWLPRIMASPDWQQARLVVLVTWDEGSASSNHIPTLVLAPTVRGVASSAAYSHCSTLRLAEEVLGLPYLGCAATAPSFRVGFRF